MISSSRCPLHSTEGERGCPRGKWPRPPRRRIRVWPTRAGGSISKVRRNMGQDNRCDNETFGTSFSKPRAGRSAATSRHGGRRACKHEDSRARGGRRQDSISDAWGKLYCTKGSRWPNDQLDQFRHDDRTLPLSLAGMTSWSRAAMPRSSSVSYPWRSAHQQPLVA